MMRQDKIPCEACPLNRLLADKIATENDVMTDRAAAWAEIEQTEQGMNAYVDDIRARQISIKEYRMQIAQAVESCEGPVMRRRLILFGQKMIVCASRLAGTVEPYRHEMPLDEYIKEGY